jgi:hypothetical protein
LFIGTAGANSSDSDIPDGFDDGFVGAFEGTAKVSSSNTFGNGEIFIVGPIVGNSLLLETTGTNSTDKFCDDILDGFDDGFVGAFEGTAKVSSSNTVGNGEIVIVRATFSLETVGTNNSDKICDDIIEGFDDGFVGVFEGFVVSIISVTVGSGDKLRGVLRSIRPFIVGLSVKATLLLEALWNDSPDKICDGTFDGYIVCSFSIIGGDDISDSSKPVVADKTNSGIFGARIISIVGLSVGANVVLHKELGIRVSGYTGVGVDAGMIGLGGPFSVLFGSVV